MNEILEKLEYEAVRIDRVIYLAGALAAMDALPDDLNDFFDGENDGTISKCLGEIPGYVDLGARSEERAEMVYEWLQKDGLLGFLVKFATPVMTHKPSSSSFSWGRYYKKWIYADTMDEAIAKGLAWADARRSIEHKAAAALGMGKDDE